MTAWKHTGTISDRISLPSDVWARIIFAAQESDDWRLKSLIEQAVMEARAEPKVKS